MVLHDEVWRKVSVLRRRKRIRSLLMRSSGQRGARRLVPRRWRRRRPGDNRGSHDGVTVTDGLAISMRQCVFLCTCVVSGALFCTDGSVTVTVRRLQLCGSGARLVIGDARRQAGDTSLFIGHVRVRSLLYLVVTGLLTLPPRGSCHPGLAGNRSRMWRGSGRLWCKGVAFFWLSDFIWSLGVGRSASLDAFSMVCGVEGTKTALLKEGGTERGRLLCYTATYAMNTIACRHASIASQPYIALDSNSVTTWRRYWRRQRANW